LRVVGEEQLTGFVLEKKLNITGFICSVVRLLLRRCTFGEVESLAVASRQHLLHRLRTNPWRGPPATLPGEDAEQEKGNSADVQRSRANTTGFTIPRHKRTEGRAPVWGSEFTTKAAHYMGI
jgi:hypothetical protein